MIFPPISPCGRPVEYLRSCYRTQVRFFKDRPDILTPIIWYFTDREDWIAWPHKFGSQNWDEWHPVDGCPVGEIGGTGTYANGKRPPEARDGPHPCGTPQQWGEGALFADALLNPCQCGGVQGEGRQVMTGNGHFVNPWPVGHGTGRMVETGDGETPTVDDGTGYQLEHGDGLGGGSGLGYMPETGDGATPTVDTGTGYMPEIGDGQIDPGRGGVEVGGSGYYPETTGGVEVGGDGYYPDSPGGVEVGGEGAIPTTDACSFAAPMPEYWSLTCDPMTNVGCDDCANTGGTFLLAHSSGCEWIQVDTFDLCGVACRFRLAREGSNFVVRLEIVSTLFTRILFLLDEDDFDPMGVNVLPFSSINAFSCTDAPASVEITPSPGP